MRQFLSALALLIGGSAIPITATAADDPPSFKDKQFTMFVGTSAGGGYDTFTRTIAPHFRHHLPGEPTIIVRNMPGAGSSTLMSHLYNAAPRDGSVIGGVNPDVVTEPLMLPSRVNFDSANMTWIGSAARNKPDRRLARLAGQDLR
jgi:tripartite-type tricarboxylate transporter receptor subunit TctC